MASSLEKLSLQLDMSDAFQSRDRAIGPLDNKPSNIRGDQTVLDQRVRPHSRKPKGYEDKLGHHEVRLADHEARLASLERRLAELDGTAAAQAKEIRFLAQENRLLQGERNDLVDVVLALSEDAKTLSEANCTESTVQSDRVARILERYRLAIEDPTRMEMAIERHRQTQLKNPRQRQPAGDEEIGTPFEDLQRHFNMV